MQHWFHLSFPPRLPSFAWPKAAWAPLTMAFLEQWYIDVTKLSILFMAFAIVYLKKAK
jgi:hypothetical protein